MREAVRSVYPTSSTSRLSRYLNTGTAPTVKSIPQFDGMPAYTRPPSASSITAISRLSCAPCDGVRPSLGCDRAGVVAVVGAELQPCRREYEDGCCHGDRRGSEFV